MSRFVCKEHDLDEPGWAEHCVCCQCVVCIPDRERGER